MDPVVVAAQDILHGGGIWYRVLDTVLSLLRAPARTRVEPPQCREAWSRGPCVMAAPQLRFAQRASYRLYRPVAHSPPSSRPKQATLCASHLVHPPPEFLRVICARSLSDWGSMPGAAQG